MGNAAAPMQVMRKEVTMRTGERRKSEAAVDPFLSG